MRQDQILYWGLVVVSVAVLWVGILSGFFTDKIFAQRAKKIQERLGKRAVELIFVPIRGLGLLLIVLSIYLLNELLRILPCALK